LLGRQDGGAQARIAIRVSARRARRYGDFLDELGEDLTATGVGGALLVFYGCPF
jgi:hypothetical protein